MKQCIEMGQLQKTQCYKNSACRTVVFVLRLLDATKCIQIELSKLLYPRCRVALTSPRNLEL